jgi:hypothetical protein
MWVKALFAGYTENGDLILLISWVVGATAETSYPSFKKSMLFL